MLDYLLALPQPPEKYDLLGRSRRGAITGATMFLPWIGKNWGDSANRLSGRKILLLGESHYSREDEAGQADPDGTLKTFDLHVLSDRSLPFFTKLLQTISGRKKHSMTTREVRDFWDSVAFYNYVPVYVSEGPRISPTNEMFESGAAPFNQVMDRLKPEIVVVCGHRLWWWLLKNAGYRDDPAKSSSLSIGGALAVRIKHPSTGFSSDHWHSVLKNHLDDLDKQAADRVLGAKSLAQR